MNKDNSSSHVNQSVPRLLIVGGGAVVCEYYIPALSALGYLDKALIIDVSDSFIESLRKWRVQLNTQQADFRSFLNKDSFQGEFDAAIVTLPNWLHEEACVKALDCGLDVLCEKPLALNYSTCIKLAEHAHARDHILAVGMVRRFLPNVLVLKKALENGLIGPLKSVDIEHGEPYAWPSMSGASFSSRNGGILADFGVHYLDLVNWLFGPLRTSDYHDDYKGGVEVNCEFNLFAKDDIPVKLRLSYSHKLRNTAIFKGERGELILEKDTQDSCLWRTYQSESPGGRLYADKPFSSGNWPLTLRSCFIEQVYCFARSISGFPERLIDARQAAQVITLIEWAYEHRSLNNKAFFNREDNSSGRPTLAPAPVVVTGGSGFIGGALVERLSDLGFGQITVPVRNYFTCASCARMHIALPSVNLLDYQQVKSALKGARYVFHLAYGRDGDAKERKSITIDGTRNIVEAAIAQGVECLIVLSSAYVFSNSNARALVDETYGYRPRGGEYGQSKAKMERWCLARARSSGKTRIVILNPTCVYGPGGQVYTKLPAEFAKENCFFWVENGEGAANYTFVDNLVDAILLCVNNPQAHGQRFIINDGTCTWRDFLSPILEPWLSNVPTYTLEELSNLKKKCPHSSLRDIIKAVISSQEVRSELNDNPLCKKFISAFARNAPGSYKKVAALNIKDAYDMLDIFPRSGKKPKHIFWLADIFGSSATVFSSLKAQEMLGWKPRIYLREGQERSILWLREIGIFK